MIKQQARFTFKFQKGGTGIFADIRLDCELTSREGEVEVMMTQEFQLWETAVTDGCRYFLEQTGGYFGLRVEVVSMQWDMAYSSFDAVKFATLNALKEAFKVSLTEDAFFDEKRSAFVFPAELHYRTYAGNIMDFIDTGEAHATHLYLGNRNIVIPFMNLGLMDRNPVNGKHCIVDYGFLVFIDVVQTSSVVINRMLPLKRKGTAPVGEPEHVMVADKEIEIYFMRASLMLSNTMKMSDPWLPFVKNMEDRDTQAFFSAEHLPEQLKALLGDRRYTLSQFGD